MSMGEHERKGIWNWTFSEISNWSVEHKQESMVLIPCYVCVCDIYVYVNYISHEIVSVCFCFQLYWARLLLHAVSCSLTGSLKTSWLNCLPKRFYSPPKSTSKEHAMLYLEGHSLEKKGGEKVLVFNDIRIGRKDKRQIFFSFST